MSKSLEKILEILQSDSSVDIVLPGHNDVINAETGVKYAQMYLEQNTKERKFHKSFSRTRAKIILGANKYFNLPLNCKEVIAN